MLYIVDVTDDIANNVEYLEIIKEWIEENIDYLNFVSQDLSTDFGVSIDIRSSLIVNNGTIVFNLDDTVTIDDLNHFIDGNDNWQLS